VKAKEIVVYSRPLCGACELLKKYLKNEGIEYHEVDGSSAAGKAEMFVDGCFPKYFPAMRIGNKILYYESLFHANGTLRDVGALLHETA